MLFPDEKLNTIEWCSIVKSVQEKILESMSMLVASPKHLLTILIATSTREISRRYCADGWWQQRDSSTFSLLAMGVWKLAEWCVRTCVDFLHTFFFQFSSQDLRTMHNALHMIKFSRCSTHILFIHFSIQAPLALIQFFHSSKLLSLFFASLGPFLTTNTIHDFLQFYACVSCLSVELVFAIRQSHFCWKDVKRKKKEQKIKRSKWRPLCVRVWVDKHDRVQYIIDTIYVHIASKHHPRIHLRIEMPSNGNENDDNVK